MRLLFSHVSFFLLALLAVTHPAAAQTMLDTTIVLPTVQVEATRTARSGSRLTTLNAEAIAATGAATVAELLEARTGLFIRRYGDSGLATASLRGAGATQTLILLDGLRVADPQSGQVDLSLLPTVLLESVEVLHGAGAALHGSGSLGGTVRLHSIQPGRAMQLRATGTAGAWGERSAGVVTSGGQGRFSGVAAAEVSVREGDFSYRNEALFPIREVQRLGADRTAQTVYGQVAYRHAEQHVSLSAWSSRTERGLPGPGTAPSGVARQWDAFDRLWLTSETRLNTATLHINALAQQSSLRYANPATGIDDTSHTRTLSLHARGDLLAGHRWLVSVGSEAAHDRAALHDGITQTRLAGFIHASAAYDRWLLLPALRADVYSGDGISRTALSPRLGIEVQPLRWSGFQLKFAAGRAFRAPTFNERFWQPGGNPDLKAERGWSAETGAGVQVQRPRSSAEAEFTVFAAWLDDQIVWYPTFAGPGVQVWRPDNLARVVTRGVEVSVRGAVQSASHLRFDGGAYLTLTDAQNRSNPNARAFGQPLRYAPRRQLKLNAGAQWRAALLDVSGRFVSRRYLASDASAWLAPYGVLDARLRLTRTMGQADVILAFALENILDARYAVLEGYPMPPRHLSLRLTVNLSDE